MTTSPVTSPDLTGTQTPSATTTNAATDPLANEQTFLKLLVSQIQHQDPLNPVDSTQFLQQLTGYSQLEQLIGIRGELAPASTTSTAPAATPTPGSK